MCAVAIPSRSSTEPTISASVGRGSLQPTEPDRPGHQVIEIGLQAHSPQVRDCKT